MPTFSGRIAYVTVITQMDGANTKTCPNWIAKMHWPEWNTVNGVPLKSVQKFNEIQSALLGFLRREIATKKAPPAQLNALGICDFNFDEHIFIWNGNPSKFDYFYAISKAQIAQCIFHSLFFSENPRRIFNFNQNFIHIRFLHSSSAPLVFAVIKHHSYFK